MTDYENPCVMVWCEILFLRGSYANPTQILRNCGLLRCNAKVNRIFAKTPWLATPWDTPWDTPLGPEPPGTFSTIWGLSKSLLKYYTFSL